MIDKPLPPDRQAEWDRQLWMMILASGIVHTLVLVLIILFPTAWLHSSPPAPVSYTVDLVAPNKLGGSNIVAGGKGRVQAAPMVAAAPPKEEAPKPEPPKPAAAKVEEAKPPEPVKPEPAKVEAPKPEVEKVEVKEVPKPAEPKVEPKPPEPKPEAAKVEPKPKEDAVALADKAKKPSPPAPTAAKAAPSPKAVAPSPNAVAKVEASKAIPTLPKVDPKAAAEAKKAADAKAAAEAKAAADAKVAAEKVAAEKAAAEKAAKENSERDSQIAAAIRRVQQKGERGGGLGEIPQTQPGGAIGAGPGVGIGGQVMGVEYLLYYNQTINRIRDSWAWAGTNEALEATLHFSITDSGEIVDVKIAKSSGDKSFDLSAERAVRAVSPLPPPPEQYRKDFADFELVFSPRDLKM